MTALESILAGGDLRSIGQSKVVVEHTRSPQDFDTLFACLFHPDRLVVMRAADAVEKITLQHSEYLAKHKEKVFALCRTAANKELLWHLALLLPRLPLTPQELHSAWRTLATWAQDPAASRIVRVNALQALYELYPRYPKGREELERLLTELEREPVPSLRARIRKIRKHLGTLL